jgi:ribosomal protein S18 acetylase RimI-like enzyme
MTKILEAINEDAPQIIALAEAHEHELGPISKHHSWLMQHIDRGEVFVAKTQEGKVVGFVSFHHKHLREDEHTTIYYLCTDSAYRRHGIGKRLMEAVAVDTRLCGNKRIMLKCPTQLPANHFYQCIGYTLEGSETDHEGGRLNVWTLSL